MPVKISPEAWEHGCQTDESRNFFVGPLIANSLPDKVNCSVFDVGCGTRYIARLAAATSKRDDLRWTLLDSNSEMIEYARTKPGLGQVTEYHCSSLQEFETSNPRARFDLSICCYTSLEVRDFGGFAASLSRLSQDGMLIFVIPDTVDDIVEHYVSKGRSSYLADKHIVDITKQNSFTGQELTFIARTPMGYLSEILRHDDRLCSVETYLDSVGRRHFAFILMPQENKL